MTNQKNDLFQKIAWYVWWLWGWVMNGGKKRKKIGHLLVIAESGWWVRGYSFY